VNSRLIIALLLSGAVSLVANAGPKEDARTIQEFRTWQKKLATDLAAASDPGERARLVRSYSEKVDSTVTKLGEPSRSAFLVSVKVVEPIQRQGADYLQIVAEYSQQGVLDFSTIRSRDDIAQRRLALDRLIESNAKLLERYNRVPQDIESELESSTLTKSQKRDFIAGFSEKFAQTAGPAKAIRTLDALAWDRLSQMLSLLEQHLGKWKFEEGKILGLDEDAERKYNALEREVQDAVERQAAAERELARRS